MGVKQIETPTSFSDEQIEALNELIAHIDKNGLLKE